MRKHILSSDDADWWVPPTPKMKVTPAPAKVAVKPQVQDDTEDPVLTLQRKGRQKEVLPHEKLLLSHFGNLARYIEASDGSDLEKISYLKFQWKAVNTKYFEGKLQPCNIHLGKDTGKRMNNRAFWQASRRLLQFSPRLFNGPEEILLETLVHEMCHQAVTDIDKTVEFINAGHGPIWQSWMIHCKLPPDRYDRYGNDMYADDTEQIHNEQVKEERKEVWKNHPALRNYEVYPGVPVIYNRGWGSHKNQTITGVIAWPIKVATLKREQKDGGPKHAWFFMVLTDPFKGKGVKLEGLWLQRYAGDQEAMYKGKVWQNVVNSLASKHAQEWDDFWTDMEETFHTSQRMPL